MLCRNLDAAVTQSICYTAGILMYVYCNDKSLAPLAISIKMIISGSGRYSLLAVHAIPLMSRRISLTAACVCRPSKRHMAAFSMLPG